MAASNGLLVRDRFVVSTLTQACAVAKDSRRRYDWSALENGPVGRDKATQRTYPFLRERGIDRN
jgi:hypothetical protein